MLLWLCKFARYFKGSLLWLTVYKSTQIDTFFKNHFPPSALSVNAIDIWHDEAGGRESLEKTLETCDDGWSVLFFELVNPQQNEFHDGTIDKVEETK